MVDCARAAILLPLGMSIYRCQPVHKCSLVETAFLLLVTVSTVNMLTTILNDSPVFPEDDEDNADLSAPLLMDSPQCVLFGTFMIWFASITINLGPTFLSGALAANTESMHNAPSCPLVHGPFRHYVLNVLWIAINLVCVILTLFHLRKLYRDLTKANVEAVRIAGLVTTLVSVTGGGNGMANGITPRSNGAMEERHRMRNYFVRVEREGVERVRMFVLIAAAYILLWGPLFFVTLVHHPSIGSPLSYEITLHISYAHAIVNPTMFLILHRGLRRGVIDIFISVLRCGRDNVGMRGLCSGKGAKAYSSSGSPDVSVPPPPLLKAPPPPLETLNAVTEMRDNDTLMSDPWGLPPLLPPIPSLSRMQPMSLSNSPPQDESE